MQTLRRKKLKSLKRSSVYDTYWKFAFERQEVLHKRLAGNVFPWTSDPIINEYKFTNCYRVLDRVSQYLVKNVIVKNDYHGEDLFLRIILFKLFNSIETWEFLENEFGNIDVESFKPKSFSKALVKRMQTGKTIFSSAYIMPSRSGNLKSPIKHENLLGLLQVMMKDNLAAKLESQPSLRSCYELIKSYPLMGNFLAYQFVIDLNYSDLVNHEESEFVVAGPGALDGISKCFLNAGEFESADIIRYMYENQTKEFDRLCLDFKYLKGRQLQLIDCQNLFCEVSKYSRISHPDVIGISKRHRIKRKYLPNSALGTITLPPKWNLSSSMPFADKIIGRKKELVYA